MQGSTTKDISRFFIAGINYKKSDAAVRGRFAINEHQYAAVLAIAPVYYVHEMFIVSTCNRTEIYGFAPDANSLIDLLCTQTSGDADTFSRIGYIKEGAEAIAHLFEVGAGLDSQILGDYEIVGQIKTAVKFAKDHGFIGAFLERLTNSMLQASKAIKNQTELSSGTVSVSFAAIQLIRRMFPDITGKKILLIGTGKIGRNTCKNLVDYLETKEITVINRTHDKASELAEELGIKSDVSENLQHQILTSDIILVATNAALPIITEEQVPLTKKQLLIDLSIPNNIDPSLSTHSNITLVNVDELSKMNDATLRKRLEEVPKAKAIIAEIQQEFLTWFDMRKHVPYIQQLQTRLGKMHNCPFYLQFIKDNASPSEEQVKRIVNGMAVKMKLNNQPGCHYIEAISEYISISVN
ncbi:MAG: hemA [Chitinophagaceae bacterium]|nr:hemA [Chitinophagaceae bacterium]